MIVTWSAKYRSVGIFFDKSLNLIDAAFNNDLGRIEKLIQSGVNVNTKNGTTPLMSAVNGKSNEAVKKLISLGAGVNERNNDGWTALFIASLDFDKETIKLLLESGADPNIANKNGGTPLSAAAADVNQGSAGHPDVVKTLLDAGANPNVIEQFGWTPLLHAAAYNQFDTVKVLLDNGADPNLQTVDGLDVVTEAKKKLGIYVSNYKGYNPPKATSIKTSGELNANGIKYVGELVNGVPNGKGTYTMADGSKYEGEVKDNNPNGQGKFTLADGSYYEGQIVNGVFEGQGTFVMADKSKYVGELKNGKPNGLGVMYAPSGVIVQQGEFKDGYLIRSTNTSTTTPTGTIGNSTSSSPSGTITTKNELQSYLEKNFGELNTSLGATKFTFDIYENTSIASAYDYWIMVKYDSKFFFDVQYSNKISSDVRTKVKQELKDHQERIGRAVVQAMPNKKFDGGYYDSWYRYPNLRVDLITRHYFSWNNYEGTLISGYENTKPSTFRWQSLIDSNF